MIEMSWQDILKKIPIPKETEGNYRGKEPATAEGRYGTKVTPKDIEREMEERRKEDEDLRRLLEEQGVKSN